MKLLLYIFHLAYITPTVHRLIIHTVMHSHLPKAHSEPDKNPTFAYKMSLVHRHLCEFFCIIIVCLSYS